MPAENGFAWSAGGGPAVWKAAPEKEMTISRMMAMLLFLRMSMARIAPRRRPCRYHADRPGARNADDVYGDGAEGVVGAPNRTRVRSSGRARTIRRKGADPTYSNGKQVRGAAPGPCDASSTWISAGLKRRIHSTR